jgi:hypothetical protein
MPISTALRRFRNRSEETGTLYLSCDFPRGLKVGDVWTSKNVFKVVRSKFVEDVGMVYFLKESPDGDVQDLLNKVRAIP